MSGTRTRDRGSATVETIIAIPGLMLVAMVVVLAGRLVNADAAVEGAARDAARGASVARTASQARIDGTQLATETLRQGGVPCSSTSVTINTAGFGVPVGRMGLVTASVTCTVPLADLTIPGIPGSRVLRKTFSSPIEPHRGRQ